MYVVVSHNANDDIKMIIYLINIIVVFYNQDFDIRVYSNTETELFFEEGYNGFEWYCIHISKEWVGKPIS